VLALASVCGQTWPRRHPPRARNKGGGRVSRRTGERSRAATRRARATTGVVLAIVQLASSWGAASRALTWPTSNGRRRCRGGEKQQQNTNENALLTVSAHLTFGGQFAAKHDVGERSGGAIVVVAGGRTTAPCHPARGSRTTIRHKWTCASCFRPASDQLPPTHRGALRRPPIILRSASLHWTIRLVILDTFASDCLAGTSMQARRRS
jgi:hypothetical protein